MRAFVTGATGFLGQRLVGQLLRAGADVRCLARPGSNLKALGETVAAGWEKPNRLGIWTGSLGRPEPWAAALQGCDVVFHLAAALSGGTAAMFTSNVIATRRLAEVCCQAQVPRFVLISSLAVYGTEKLRPGDFLDEHCPLDAEPHRRDAYSYSKIAQEEAAWEARQNMGLPLVVVRPGVIYGPGRDCLTGRVGLRVGGWLIRMGGRQQLPYTFVDDCAAAVRLAGTTNGIEGQAFNVVDDDLPTGRQLLRRYRREVGRVRTVPVPRWGIAPLSRLCEWYHGWSRGQLPAVLTRYKSAAQWKPLRYCNAKAKVFLGWHPQMGLDEGLRQTFAWLRRDHAGSFRVKADP